MDMHIFAEQIRGRREYLWIYRVHVKIYIFKSTVVGIHCECVIGGAPRAPDGVVVDRGRSLSELPSLLLSCNLLTAPFARPKVQVRWSRGQRRAGSSSVEVSGRNMTLIYYVPGYDYK